MTDSAKANFNKLKSNSSLKWMYPGAFAVLEQVTTLFKQLLLKFLQSIAGRRSCWLVVCHAWD